MQGNKIRDDNNTISKINEVLDKTSTNPYVICKYISDANEIVEDMFVLDDVAFKILKAYYKSKEISGG